MSSEHFFPSRSQNPPHHNKSYGGLDYVVGTFESTGRAPDEVEPPGTLVYQKNYGGYPYWISDGVGGWAGVSNGKVLGFIGKFFDSNNPTKGWVVLRPVSKSGPTTNVPAAKPVSKSDWNGRCGRCGKGTYTGLFNTEHEGGPCTISG